MRESEYTRAVGKGLPKEIYKWKVSDRFTAGVPDAWYSGNKDDLWVEYKFVQKIPKKVKPKLSKLQEKWLNDRAAQGRSVAVIVGSPLGAVILVDGAWNHSSEWGSLKSKKEVIEWITQQTMHYTPLNSTTPTPKPGN
jgi:hypothetical protein